MNLTHCEARSDSHLKGWLVLARLLIGKRTVAAQSLAALSLATASLMVPATSFAQTQAYSQAQIQAQAQSQGQSQGQTRATDQAVSRGVPLGAPAPTSAVPALPYAAPVAPTTLPGRGESLPNTQPPVALSDAKVERARLQLEAGVRYENGEGVLPDLNRAQNLYCEAAKSEIPDAFIRLGWMYANGRGVPRSEAVAYTLFRRAAGLGSEMGEQLSQLYQGHPRRMPPCLGGDVLPEDAPAPAKVVTLAQTPTVEDPAQFKSTLPTTERRKIVEMVVKLSKQIKLDPRLVLALIGTESGFDPLARSVKNAQGLMQLIPDTAERFAVRDMLDPAENLRGGMSYLRWLLAYYRGDVWLAVAAYNAGEGAVDRFRGIPPYAETMAYVQRIRNQYPLDRHPFDASAAPPSIILSGKRTGPTTLLFKPAPG
jgi:Transglycosylase SLT domain/Sel1 repeat